MYGLGGVTYVTFLGVVSILKCLCGTPFRYDLSGSCREPLYQLHGLLVECEVARGPALTARPVRILMAFY